MNSPSSNNPFVSVVINYYNEKDNVDLAFKSLASQTYHDFEVILVDDGSTDGTTEKILGGYGNLLNVHVIRLIKNIGLRPARNMGVRNAKGCIIITLDMHVQFDSFFLERIVKAFNENSKIGACGCLVLGMGDSWFNKGFRYMEEFSFKIRARSGSYKYVFGAAAAFRSEIFELIGYLSENEITEDEDISWRLAKAGWDVRLLKDNVVYHKEPSRFVDFTKKLFNIGLRAAPVLLKHKSMLIRPQNSIRFIALPLCIIFLSLIKVEFVFFLFLCYLVCIPVIFVLTRNEFKKAFYVIPILILFIFFTTAGFYYGLMLNILKRIKILKKFSVDIKR